ncbi:Zinc finger protein zas1 [Madurella mycetomatis]|uniref:Zinc finger protein zas1 n=1 Tax=Madurella mycetomatis TaxID=100816 RepID=A0A175WB63_9PEZI|nr:Zinc finger protein zas1 [Madurella mycetomatis]
MPGYSATSHESQLLPMYPPFDVGSGTQSQMPTGPWNSLPISASPPSNNDVIRSLADSPVEPLQDFDIDMALQLDGYLRDTLPLGATIPLPNTPSVGLFNNLDFTGVNFSSDLDFALPAPNGSPFTPPSTASPGSSVHSSQGLVAVGNNPSQYPLTPASLSPAGSSPASTPSPATMTPTTTQLLPCTEPSCPKTFTKRSDLRRHERKHRQPFPCALCGKGHLDKRALARHLWAKHAEYAQQHNTRSERVKCKLCDYEGRQDNVARHMKRHTRTGKGE